MRNLLDFLKDYYHWLLFVFLEVVSGFLLFQYNNYQASVWFSSANSMMGKVYEWSSEATKFFTLSEANEQLTKRNLLLEQHVDMLRSRYMELTHDSTVQERNEMKFLAQYDLIPAKVVDNSLDSKENLMTIDKGRADGVAVDMGECQFFAYQLRHPQPRLFRLSALVRRRSLCGLCGGCAPSCEVQVGRVGGHQRLLVDIPFRGVCGKDRTGLQLARRSVV